MREILFKGKRIDNGEWVEGFLFHCLNNGEELCIGNEPLSAYDYSEIIGEYRTWFPIDENTICQYTGLTDKNGNKIWENDIVKGLFYHGLEVKAVVSFKYGAFGLKWNRGDVEEFSAFTSICNVEYEIIGNIFDNPELLEGGAE